jgi:hypothetical protein
MKRFLIVLFFSLTNYTVFSQSLKLNPVVDERVELLSIVFRLAGAREYSQTNIASYSSDINTYFNSYKEDEVVKLVRKARRRNKVSYDAVMSMAAHIVCVNDSFKLRDDIEKQSLDKRWGKYTERFIVLLNNFYRKTNFHKFCSDHTKLYETTEERFSESLSNIDIAWFEKFFGEKPKGSFNLILSLASGGGNYGSTVKFTNGNKDIYSFICIRRTDSLGFPVFKADEYSGVIIHEFCHSFCNPLIEKYYSEMQSSAEKLFKLVKNIIGPQAYTKSIDMCYETLVRASTIMYFKEHQTTERELNKMIGSNRERGFICIKPIVNSLEQYQKSRTTYNNLDSYMPQIVSLFNSLNSKELLKESHCKGTAQIIDFSIKNNSMDVDPNTKELVVKFDSPMSGSHGLSYGKGGKKHFPQLVSGKSKWNQEKMTELTIYIKLEPDKKYSIEFPSIFFLDENYCEIKETYYLNFKTKK